MTYEEQEGKSYRMGKDGLEVMANFTARITVETRYVDGAGGQTVFTVEGERQEKTEDGQAQLISLPAVEIDAEVFGTMNWVARSWGSRCVIYPGSGIKDDLRTMIQVNSRPEVKTIYQQTGWVTIGKKRMYLHVGGAIGATGNDRSVSVRLPSELSRYDLSEPAAPEEAIPATLALLGVARPELTWPLLAASLAPVYGPCDFAVHLAGRTGSYKSEVASLFQSLYGPMDARHLPGSWSSTPNAIEALAYRAANAVFVLDDFVPSGSAYQQRAIQANADKILRAQGNQAGRARLTDVSSLQTTMYPRGLILSTGEDTPEGHSVRARLLILEMVPGEISPDDLTAAQTLRPLYSGTVAWLVRSLAQEPADLRPRAEGLRGELRHIGHSRTPGMLGRLIAVAEDFLTRCVTGGFLTASQAEEHTADAQRAILAAGEGQRAYLEDADPVDVFRAALRQVVASGGGHFRTLNGGVPADAELLGWTAERDASGTPEGYKSRGPCIGWVKRSDGELYLEATAGLNAVKKAAGAELPLTRMTLLKRLKDAGALCRADEARQRNTVRVVAENHPRQVLCLPLAETLELKEADNGIPFAEPV